MSRSANVVAPVPRGLCFRCEHRARYLEEGSHRPRWECGETQKSVHSCYMFLHCRPPVIKKNRADKRPILSNMLSARVQYVDLANGEWYMAKIKSGKYRGKYVINFVSHDIIKKEG